MSFSKNEKHFYEGVVTDTAFDFCELTVEKDNLMQFYGWSIPYIWPS